MATENIPTDITVETARALNAKAVGLSKTTLGSTFRSLKYSLLFFFAILVATTPAITAAVPESPNA